MTIYSYEQIQAREKVPNACGQEDKLVKWFVAQTNAHCATLEPKKRLVFKVLSEFRKADVLVRLFTDAVDPTNEDEWVDRRVWLCLQFKSADLNERGRWCFNHCLGYAGMLAVCGGAKVRGMHDDYHLWVANGGAICKETLMTSGVTHKLSMGDNTNSGTKNSNATMVDSISIPDLVTMLRRTIRGAKKAIASNEAPTYPLVSGHEAFFHIPWIEHRKEAILMHASEQVHSSWHFANMEGNQAEWDAEVTMPDESEGKLQYKWYNNEGAGANLNRRVKGVETQPYSVDTQITLFVIGCILKLDKLYYLVEAHLTKDQLKEMGYLSAPGVQGKQTISLPRLPQMGYRGKLRGYNTRRLVPIAEGGIGFRPLVELTPTRTLTAEMLDSVATGRVDGNRTEMDAMVAKRTAKRKAEAPARAPKKAKTATEEYFQVEAVIAILESKLATAADRAGIESALAKCRAVLDSM
jgi:hypothetical protein